VADIFFTKTPLAADFKAAPSPAAEHAINRQAVNLLLLLQLAYGEQHAHGLASPEALWVLSQRKAARSRNLVKV
jgi:hypothetical protein